MSIPLSEHIPLGPPDLLRAKRVTGMVVVPESHEFDQDQGDPLDLDWNASISNFAEQGPPTLRRRSSLSGNILKVEDPQGEKAYFLQRKISKTSYGSVRVGFLLQSTGDESGMGVEYNVVRSDGPYPFEMVAIKMHRLSPIMDPESEECEHSSSLEVANTELAALKMVADKNPRGNVEYSLCTCSDHNTTYAIVPFHGEGNLFQYVVECGSLEETVARHFFKKILMGLKTLRQVGLYHRNLSLENVHLRASECTLAELGTCIRIPPDNPALEPHLAAGGSPRYLPPEVVRTQVFDGHAADLWASGIMLCQMVFGIEAPFVWASAEDRRFMEICVNGNLVDIVQRWHMANPHKRTKATPPSQEVLDLIQNMLRANPQDRFTLEQCFQHVWLQGDTVAPTFPTPVMRKRED